MAEHIQIKQLRRADINHIETTLDVNGKLCFDTTNDGDLFLPIAFARDTFEIAVVQPPRTEQQLVFTAVLRPEQIGIGDRVKNKLNTVGYAKLSARPGFGKTIVAIDIACACGAKTLIVVNKLILIKQWQEAISKFSNGTCQIVKSKDIALDKTASFYIVNAININKHSRDFWSCIEFLVVDELHQIVTEKNINGLLLIEPHYVLGLSATPYRYDEYKNAIDWFFGKYSIEYKLVAKHTVLILQTQFAPTGLKSTYKGLDWNDVINQQSMCRERNELIVDNIAARLDRTWLILVKRVEHAKSLVQLFSEREIKTTTLLGNAIDFDRTCRVLIGTTSKIGVGFDHANIDALCVAADVKQYFVQFLGRAMRRKDVEPLVLDFKDKFRVLQSHLEERKQEYKKYGGIIEEIK